LRHENEAAHELAVLLADEVIVRSLPLQLLVGELETERPAKNLVAEEDARLVCGGTVENPRERSMLH
jgi:hypothetical protein